MAKRPSNSAKGLLRELVRTNVCATRSSSCSLAFRKVGSYTAGNIWQQHTTGSFQSCVRRPTFPTSSNVTVPASETLSRTCSASSNNMMESSQKADCQTAYAYSICCNFRGNSLCVDLWAASRLEIRQIRIAAVRTCFLGFFWSIKSKIRSKSILGATSAHASTASSSNSWTAESSNAFEPWHGPRSHNLIRAQHSDRDNGNIVSTNVRGRGCPHQIKLFRQDSFANEWLKSSGAASHGNKHQVEASKRTPLHAGYTVLLLC